MQPSQAQLLWQFVEFHREQESIIVHCEAGASRSPSVAMALADGLGLDRGVIDWYAPHGSPPNRHVYWMTMSAAPTREK